MIMYYNILPFFCRTITFHSEGHCIFSGSHDSLKVHSWEPNQVKDTLLMGWGKIKDISIASNQLVRIYFIMYSRYFHTGVSNLQWYNHWNEFERLSYTFGSEKLLMGWGKIKDIKDYFPEHKTGLIDIMWGTSVKG